jgi:23S rRNA (uridine2552-2'-O)-methyltransferase
MRYSLANLAKSGSSSRWVQRQQNDPYVRLRATALSSPGSSTGSKSNPDSAKVQELGSLRSRSAFKLVSLAKSYPLLGSGRTVVDLGAAPGGWSQVAAAQSGGRGKVIAVDINHMESIPGVDFIQGDFLDASVHQRVADLLQRRRSPTNDSLERTGHVDTVLSDMMAPMSGVRDRDVAASLDLVMAATSFGLGTLKVGSGEELETVKGKKAYEGGNMV